MFAGPLADDLRLARPDATDAELRGALAAVGAQDWVDALPDGLATVVGEGGHPLTATQAQQLALARVALADPPVVVLDEATAEAGSAGARELERSAARGHRAGAPRWSSRTGSPRPRRPTGSWCSTTAGSSRTARTPKLAASTGPYAALWAAWSTSRQPDRLPG